MEIDVQEGMIGEHRETPYTSEGDRFVSIKGTVSSNESAVDGLTAEWWFVEIEEGEWIFTIGLLDPPIDDHGWSMFQYLEEGFVQVNP